MGSPEPGPPGAPAEQPAHGSPLLCFRSITPAGLFPLPRPWPPLPGPPLFLLSAHSQRPVWRKPQRSPLQPACCCPGTAEPPVAQTRRGHTTAHPERGAREGGLDLRLLEKPWRSFRALEPSTLRKGSAGSVATPLEGVRSMESRSFCRSGGQSGSQGKHFVQNKKNLLDSPKTAQGASDQRQARYTLSQGSPDWSPRSTVWPREQNTPWSSSLKRIS